MEIIWIYYGFSRCNCKFYAFHYFFPVSYSPRKHIEYVNFVYIDYIGGKWCPRAVIFCDVYITNKSDFVGICCWWKMTHLTLCTWIHTIRIKESEPYRLRWRNRRTKRYFYRVTWTLAWSSMIGCVCVRQDVDCWSYIDLELKDWNRTIWWPSWRYLAYCRVGDPGPYSNYSFTKHGHITESLMFCVHACCFCCKKTCTLF